MDEQKIAKEIKTKGFAIAKCDMNDESPDEWVLFGVWFYLKQDFYVDLDWRIGKYYFYVDSGKEIVKSKEPKNKTLDFYSAEKYLSNNLLKHYSKLNDIADTIVKDGLFVTNDKSIIKIMDNQDYRAVLYWIVTEVVEDCFGVAGIVHEEQPLMMLTNIENRDKIIEMAKAKGFNTHKEKLFEDEDDEDFLIEKVDGFEELDFSF